MIKFRYQFTVDRPLEEVFAFVTHMENLPRWAAGVIEVKQVSAGPLGPGTRYRLTAKPPVGPKTYSECVFAEYEPGRKLTNKSNFGPIPFTEVYYFTPAGTGTTIDYETEMRPGGFLALFQFPIRLLITRLIKSDECGHNAW